MELQLPPVKIDRLSLLLNQMTNRNSATKKELQSLAGCLQHAATDGSEARAHISLANIRTDCNATARSSPRPFE